MTLTDEWPPSAVRRFPEQALDVGDALLMLIASVLAACGSSGDERPAGKGFTTCPPLLGSAHVFTKKDVDTCLDLGGMSKVCADGTEVSVVTVDDQQWALLPGERSKKVSSVDFTSLCSSRGGL